MENIDIETVETEIELSIPLQLARVVIAAGIGFLASEMTKKAFDKVIVARLAKDVIDIKSD